MVRAETPEFPFSFYSQVVIASDMARDDDFMLTAEEIRLRACISRIAVASLAQNAFSALAVHAAVLLGRYRGRPSTAGG